MGLLLFQRGALGGHGGGGAADGRPLYILPEFKYRPIFDFQSSAILAWAWQPLAAVQFNASNPNGVIAKILRVLQIDQFVKGMKLEGMSRHIHEVEAANSSQSFRPASTPGSAAGHGYSGHGDHER
jgi:hypothetical protein